MADTAILPCGSIASNTGVIVALATLEVVKSGRAGALSFPSLANKVRRQFKIAENVRRIIVIDGCKNECARKLADNLGLQYEAYLNLAELGIEKRGPFSSLEFDKEQVKLVRNVLIDLIEGRG